MTHLPAAITYLTRGWSTIPLCPPDHAGVSGGHEKICRAPGKTPLYPWKEYQTRLPREAELRILWERNPNANVGIVLGTVSSLIGIDVDGSAGEELLQKISNGDLPLTLQFTTPHGRRLLYRLTHDNTSSPSWATGLNHEELRILSNGHVTVVPPSPGYNWTNYIDKSAEIPPAPHWVLNHQSQQPDNLTRATKYLAACDPAVSGHAGHNQTFKIACKLASFGITQEQATLLILRDYNPRCQPPWTEQEITHKVHDAYKTQRHPDTIRANTLASTLIAPLRWSVPGFICEGATILAGRPKTGKSWLTLQLALAVSTGSRVLQAFQATPGRVLYMALEDGPGRLQTRTKKLSSAMQVQPPDTLEFSTKWPRVGNGALEHIKHWLQHNQDAKLVVVDTLARIRQYRTSKGSIYEEDYEAIACLKDLADEFHISCVIVHHTRKGISDDPIEEVSGTLALTGAADAIAVLKRARHATTGTIFFTGRDIEDIQYDLVFSSATCLWSTDKRIADPLTPTQRRIASALYACSEPVAPMQLAKVMNAEYSAIKSALWRMHKDGLLEKTGEAYYPTDLCNPCNPCNFGPNLLDTMTLEGCTPESTVATHATHATQDATQQPQ